MTTCACGGNSKLIIDKYVINTRIPGNRQIILKNVRYRQCKICGEMELTEDSQKWVDGLRSHYMHNHYEKNKEQSDTPIEDSSPVKVKDFFKLFRL
ncbi:YgiT-type zinc finger protein [Priestia megaterium]|uniref:YgiT-type zinc finger protein n=1 Tax=Priestia megaterium TaxID=1404 RepID=UPI001E1098B4|nr:YgiT-type zinc finger protein [Priestia megaterium]